MYKGTGNGYKYKYFADKWCARVGQHKQTVQQQPLQPSGRQSFQNLCSGFGCCFQSPAAPAYQTFISALHEYIKQIGGAKQQASLCNVVLRFDTVGCEPTA